MNETTMPDATPSEVAQYQAAIDSYLAQMEKMQLEIAGNRQQTAKLKAETELILADTLKILKVN